MFNDRKPFGLKLVIMLTILNALATVVHFVLIGQGLVETPGIIQPLWITAVTAVVSGVLPSLLGIYGLHLKRLWGLSFFVFGCGAYLSMALLVLMTTLEDSGLGIMSFVSIYLIVYSLISVLYTWSFKHHLREF